ncbi:hypothetical protein GF342_02565 [Candidatus Woesearchaeota archaeon]|nr:hypothetical protein [Candidatus Woesearchaeota archaeon]
MRALIVLVAIAMLWGCTSYQATLEENTTAPEGIKVLISDYKFHPQTLMASVNDTIIWQNLDKDPHSILFQEEESPLLEKGDTYSVRVEQPGRFNYSSGNHPFIEGIIRVET